MFKRMVTMRKAVHKRDADTTPRGIESDDLVEELGKERSRTSRAQKSRDTALQAARRSEALDRRRVADLKTSQETFSDRERHLRNENDRLVHQRDQLRDQLVAEEDQQRILRRDLQQLKQALSREQNRSVFFKDEAQAADARAVHAQEESAAKVLELSAEQEKATSKARDAEQALAERDALTSERDQLATQLAEARVELADWRTRTTSAEAELATRKANQDGLEREAQVAARAISDAERRCDDAANAARSAAHAEVSLAKRNETSMRSRVDACEAQTLKCEGDAAQALKDRDHARRTAKLAVAVQQDAAAAGSLRELAAKLLDDDKEDPTIGAARMLDRVWDLVEELLAFAGFGAAQDALRAERLCPGRAPPPVAAFLGPGEAQTYAENAATSLVECLRGERRATFEKRWLRHVPPRAAHQKALARLRVTCAALFALGSCRKRTRARDSSDAPAGAEERAAYAALTEALMHVGDETNTYAVLASLKKPWGDATFSPLFDGDDHWQLLKATTCAEIRDVLMRELPRVAPPKLLVLFRAYETWQTGLVQATLNAREGKAQVSKAALELLVVCAWLVNDVEQARGMALPEEEDNNDDGDSTLKDGNFVENRPARVLLRVKTRLHDLQLQLKTHGAFEDVSTQHGDTDALAGAKALALWLPPPLDGQRLRETYTVEVLAALNARLPDAGADLRTAATLQVLIREDALGVCASKLVPRLNEEGASGRLVTCLAARVAAHQEGRQYLLLGVAGAPAVVEAEEDEEDEEEEDEEDEEEDDEEEDDEEEDDDDKGASPAPAKPQVPVVAGAEDVVAALLALATTDAVTARTAYAAVALQRLTLEDVVARRVARNTDSFIARVAATCESHGVVAAALAGALVNALADHASEVSDALEAVRQLVAAARVTRDAATDCSEAIVERVLGAAYCLAQTASARKQFQDDFDLEHDLDEFLASERERMRESEAARTFAFEVSCVADALRGLDVEAPADATPPPTKPLPPIEAAFPGGDCLEEYDAEACAPAPAPAPGSWDYERHLEPLYLVARRDEARAPDAPRVMDEPP